jgi:hypothetical protein
MAINEKKILYSFDIDIEKEVTRDVEVEREVEVEKEVEVKKRRKNKETGKMETYTVTEKKKVKEKEIVTESRTDLAKRPVKIIFKRPTRTQLEDGDMFYSIQLNKFIKMGLLTRAMLAKQHIDVGGTLDEEEKKYYSGLYVRLYEKQMQLQRYALTPEADFTDTQKEKRDKTVAEVGLIRKDLTDFETVQASMFEHTADIKARNKAITWYLLHLAHWKDLEEGKEEEDIIPLFGSGTYEDRYDVYQSKEEEDDEIFWGSIDKLSSIATIWYMSGVQEKEDFDTLLEEVTGDAMLNEPVKAE